MCVTSIQIFHKSLWNLWWNIFHAFFAGYCWKQLFSQASITEGGTFPCRYTYLSNTVNILLKYNATKHFQVKKKRKQTAKQHKKTPPNKPSLTKFSYLPLLLRRATNCLKLEAVLHSKYMRGSYILHRNYKHRQNTKMKGY